MPGQNAARQFGGEQMNFEFNLRPADRLSHQHYERDPRHTPPPHHPAPPSYSDRFLPPIRTNEQYYYEPPQRLGVYRPDDPLPPERFSYPVTSEEGLRGRSSWRPPSLPDRRLSQNFNADTWGRPPSPPQRREILAQPMFEPSENWKQTHSLPSDRYERPHEFRSPDLQPRERERSVDRGFHPHEQYPPSAFVPGPGYRNEHLRPIGLQSPHNYTPPADNYRHQYNTSPPFSPLSYPPPLGHRNFAEPQHREPSRIAAWEARLSSPRTEPNRSVMFRHERIAGASATHSQDDPPPAMFRNRPAPQEYSRQNIPAQASGWIQPNRTSGPQLPNLHSRLSSTSEESAEHPRLQSSPSTPPSRENQRPPIHSLTKEQHHDIPPVQIARSDTLSKSQEHTSYTQKNLQTVSKVDTKMEAPSARAQASDLERIVNYEWPSSPAAPLPSIMTNISISTEETDEAAVSRLLEPEPEKSTGNIRAPSPTPAAAEPEHKDIAPALRVQESPEPDIPLALQTAASRGVTTTPSVPVTPLGESTTGPGESNPSQPSLEERLADIPPMPMFEALRVIVMVRLQQQTQTREERVDPVLMDNLSKVEPVLPSIATPTDLIREVESGERLQACKETLESTKESLEIRFAKRQMDLNEKVERLRTEYLALHQQWTTHCAKLDEVAKNLALQEAAATAGRTTRRSAASMGDAVRSDLEMEQIIASLGNEELTDATHLGARNAAMIPDMIAVVVGEIEYAYDDTNNEVEDPAKYYAPRTGTYDWTEEEVSTFVEKFAQYPKQFGIIADFLPHKTAAQCVTFYYLHKNKHIDFRKVVASRVVKRKRGGRKQKNNALLTDIRQRDAEAAPTRRRKGGGSLPVPEPRKPSTRRAVLQSENTPTATPTPEPESEPRRRRARNTAKVTALEEEETNNDEDATPKPAKRGKRTRKPRQPSSTPISTPTITEDIPPFANAIFNEHGQLASVNEQQASNAVWTTSDKSMLAELLMRYGENYDRIATFMPGKTATQIFQFYQTRGAELRPSRITPSLSMAPAPPATQAYRLSEPLIDGGLSREPYRIRTHSGETSASSSAFTASPIPPSMRHSPFDPVYTSPNTPQQFTPNLTRGSFDVPPLPHPAQYPGNNNMSHLSIPPIPMPDNRIANPSPFATSSPFPDFTYSHSPIPHLSAVTTLPEESRMNKRGSAGSSMAFDTAPNFVPPPQTWTHAPLGTTDDLVAYLEHRTRLSQQK